MKTPSKRTRPRFTAFDLFSGAGGLTLGLMKAGFHVRAAIEFDQEIARTYEKNFPNIKLLVKDIRKVSGADLLKASDISGVDLIAGCPPCQGFSKLTDKWDEDDDRNELVLEMARIVLELKPRVCMMENVPGLAGRGSPLLNEFEKRLRSVGYVINRSVLQMADYGVPQSRRRLVLLAGMGFEVPLPEPTHARIPDDSSSLEPWITVRDALVDHRKPVALSEANAKGGPKRFNWNVTRSVKPITVQRLQFLGNGGNRLQLPQKLRPKCHKDAEEGFSNVYGRMRWDEVSPTITSGCLTLSSGRFGHPQKNRTISVREAASLQTFPKSFRFDTKTVRVACQMVGNALPYRFARLVSRHCMNALIEWKPES